MSTTVAGKIAVVTGTSSGIGLATAVQLAQAGFTVIATMRDPSKAGPLEDLARQAGVTVALRPLDIADDASVAAAIKEIHATYGRIDLLVNNAGAGFFSPMEHTSPEALR